MAEPIIVPKAIHSASTCMTSRTRGSARSFPYWVDDVTANAGFVSVGITSDPAEFPCRRSVAGANAWDDSAIRMRAS